MGMGNPKLWNYNRYAHAHAMLLSYSQPPMANNIITVILIIAIGTCNDTLIWVG